MLKSLLFHSLLLICFSVSGQYPNNPLPQYPVTWNSNWITHPDIDPAAYGLIHFRNSFELNEKPSSFIVHVSGDNRYRLFVNNTEICYGPQLADIRHWRYETIDLSPFLKQGKNTIAAEVINWGIERSYGIISFKTAFLMQGHSEKESIVNTGYNNNWKVLKNEGVFEKPVLWRTSGEIVGGFYASNPTDSIVAEIYPWGWKEINYEDSLWKLPEVIFSQPKTNAGAGHGWILQARTTAIQVSKKERLTGIVQTNIKGVKKNFKFGDTPVLIPPYSSRSILIDQKYVTIGYPKLTLSGGKDAHIKVIYSEALYDKHNLKGNRNDLKGKVIKGISDVYVMDGGEKRIFQALWMRAFRFIQLEITTYDEPLIINDYYNVYSASPIPIRAKFETDNPLYDEVWNVCQHGLKICAQDNLISDAYYEQLQYVGDLRPHLKAWTALTGDLSYFRSAMEQFNNSRLPDGNITSCYPLKATFVHPTYSLIWIDMLHDLMMLDGDKNLIGAYKNEIGEVFDYYESLINENGLVGKSNYMMFIDWYIPRSGNSVVNKDGNSAILTLNYAYSLKLASEIINWLGDSKLSEEYAVRSTKYAQTVRKLCFDTDRGIYADDPAKSFYDQRATILAILCGAHNKDESAILMKKLLDDQTEFDSYANLFYYFYLFEAMEQTGVGNFAKSLEPWKEIIDAGMSATPEKRITQNPRSEVHPWSAHPVHYFYSIVAGIHPASPGFNSVTITPNPADMDFIHAIYPTKHGEILVNLQFKDEGKCEGFITLPGRMTGKFLWNGRSVELHPGKNPITGK